jgi:hypothetical protein
MQFSLISLEQMVSRGSWCCSASKLISVPEIPRIWLVDLEPGLLSAYGRPGIMAFPLAKIHASLVKWVPGQPPVRRPLRFRPLPPRPYFPLLRRCSCQPKILLWCPIPQIPYYASSDLCEEDATPEY